MTRAVAAIDVGSNSVQLTMARIEDGRVLIIDRLKNPARLGDAVGPDGYLEPEKVDRLIDTFRAFRRRIDAHDALFRATGTAALRAARDGEAFVERVAAETGIRIERISGAEEGRLVLIGVLHGLPRLREAAPLCIDVGGGSTELVLGRRARVAAVTSLPIGSLVVCRRWLGPDPISRRTVKKARRHLEQRLGARAAAIARLGFSDVVATGGSIQRIVRIALALDGRRPVSVHGHRLDRETLSAVVDRLVRATTAADRRALPGMDPERADTLLGGALILDVLGRILDVRTWTVSMDALRTGLLLDISARGSGTAIPGE